MKQFNSGFTLIEILVALVVVAVALPGFVVGVQGIQDNTAYIQDKTYAYWVADNKLQETLLDTHIRKRLPISKDQDSVEYAGIEWNWQTEVVTTPQPGILRLYVRVGIEDDFWLATLSGYLADPSYKRPAQDLNLNDIDQENILFE